MSKQDKDDRWEWAAAQQRRLAAFKHVSDLDPDRITDMAMDYDEDGRPRLLMRLAPESQMIEIEITDPSDATREDEA